LPILELENISKHFGAIHALDGVNLTLDHGEALGLMGDNGAGKSTLVKIIAGNFPPTGGEIRIEGQAVHFAKPVEARQKGVEVVYQDLALCNNLSAAANVFLGREVKKGIGPLRWLDHATMAKRAGQLFSELKSETRPRDLVRQMSGGQRQAVAIARTRRSKAKMVLMDEPTARFGHGDHPDLSPNARRLRGLRPRDGDEARPQGRRQKDQRVFARGSDWADHWRDSNGMRRE
jgi:simple sugar transport system ATP-binding protein